MGSIPGNFPISLRSWPSNKPKENQPTFLERLAFERGGFLGVTEESLRQEIAEAEAVEAGDENVSTDDGEEEPDRMKELMLARDKILHDTSHAWAGAEESLDLVSLLLSKYIPSQTITTISQRVRNITEIGTLGSDSLPVPSTLTAERRLRNKQIARGLKAKGIDKTVDHLLASASRLEKSVEAETIYWDKVLAVSDSGWSVYKFVADKCLGVDFGFSEASATFKRRSRAALRRNPDGSIYLDQGLGYSEPQCLWVRIQEGETFTGCSEIPSPAPEDAEVETLIFQARNNIFDQELWQEMNREARNLGYLSVRTKGDTLIVPVGPQKNLILDLVALTDEPNSQPRTENNRLAAGILLALRLLLCYSHRRNHSRRTSPRVFKSQKRPHPTHHLIRSLLGRLRHQNTLTSFESFLKPLTAVLSRLSLPSKPAYEIIPKIYKLPDSLSNSEKVIRKLTTNLEAVTTLTLSPIHWIRIAIQTPLDPANSILFISVSDPVSSLCPTMAKLPNLIEVQSYILHATSCVLASIVRQASNLKEGLEWSHTSSPNILGRNLEGGGTTQISFETGLVRGKEGEVREVKVVAEWMGSWFEKVDLDDVIEGNGEEEVKREGKDGQKVGKREGKWVWCSNDEGEVEKTLFDALREAGRK